MAYSLPAAPDLGVAFGGGTARGLAHVGALKALEARGVIPGALAGTSSGAVIAALYALGMPAVEIEHVVRRQNTLELWSQGVDFGLHRAALVHGRRLERWLDRKVFFGATFDDCAVPLAIACTDLDRGELVVLRSGTLARAVMASCALPGLFAPVEVDGRFLVDGGFVEAVPFSALASLGPRRMLGLHAGLDPANSRLVAGLRRISASKAARAWTRLSRSIGTRSAAARLVRGIHCALDSYLTPQHVPTEAVLVTLDPPVAWWDFHRSPEAIAAGQAAMEEFLDRLPLSSDTGVAGPAGAAEG